MIFGFSFSGAFDIESGVSFFKLPFTVIDQIAAEGLIHPMVHPEVMTVVDDQESLVLISWTA